MAIIGGRIVIDRQGEYPYKLVLQHEPPDTSEHPVASVREGEAILRKALPPPEKVQGRYSALAMDR
jgi:hypothetical protein